MNKVITINLNGRAYQLEEAGYEVLHRYLKQAAAKLKGNPDHDEIMADFEQAVADKCDQYLTGHKTVVSAAEVERIIDDMGPVQEPESDESGSKHDGTRPNGGPGVVKRLYLIKDGSWIMGVCTGIAAYLDVDVTWVRLVAVAFLLMTHGLAVLLYILAALIMPMANTPEEKAAAKGEAFNAQEILEKAQEKYSQLTNDGQVFRDKERWRDLETSLSRVARKIGSLIIVVAGSAALVALIWTGLVGIGSILTTGRVMGYTLDPVMSKWWLLAFGASAWFVVVWPLWAVVEWAHRHFHSEVLKLSGMARIWLIAGTVLWVLALAATVVIPWTSPQIQNVVEHGNGRLDLGARSICVDTCGQ